MNKQFSDDSLVSKINSNWIHSRNATKKPI